MAGMTILSTVAYPIYGWEWTTAAIVLFVVIIIVALGIIHFSISEDAPELLFFLIILIFPLMFMLDAGEVEIDSYDVHKVTVSESVSLTEFYDRYEVLNQEGLIFTVTEKGNPIPSEYK